jgi:hypothetical protein
LSRAVAASPPWRGCLFCQAFPAGSVLSGKRSTGLRANVIPPHFYTFLPPELKEFDPIKELGNNPHFLFHSYLSCCRGNYFVHFELPGDFQFFLCLGPKANFKRLKPLISGKVLIQIADV